MKHKPNVPKVVLIRSMGSLLMMNDPDRKISLFIETDSEMDFGIQYVY